MSTLSTERCDVLATASAHSTRDEARAKGAP